MSRTRSNRHRRRFSNEFKIGAVKLVTEQGYSINEAARRLEVDRKSLCEWINKFAPNFDVTAAAKDTPDDPKAMAAQLRDLRKENDRLRMENEILKKATACFAKDQL
jgi:transposase